MILNNIDIFVHSSFQQKKSAGLFSYFQYVFFFNQVLTGNSLGCQGCPPGFIQPSTPLGLGLQAQRLREALAEAEAKIAGVQAGDIHQA